MTYPYVSINNDFQIEIKTAFDFDQSNPLQRHYLFSYTILITNLGNVESQLLSRKWFIKDGKGEVKQIEGLGVVGQTPLLKLGQAFEYTSFCPLPTMSGEMWGHFNMVDVQGNKFKVETPVFKFCVPEEFIDRY